MERVLSGRNACCSSSNVSSVTWRCQPGQLVLRQRAATVVVVATVPSRSGKGRPPAQNSGKKPGSNVSSKKSSSNAKGKQLAKASPSPPKAQRPSSSSKAATAEPPARALTRATASPKLPRPAAHAGPSGPTLPVGSQPKPAAVSAASSKAPATEVVAGFDENPSGPAAQGSRTQTPASAPAAPAAVTTSEALDPHWDTDVDGGDGDDDSGDGFLIDDNLEEDGGAGAADDAGEGDEDEEGFHEIQFNLPNPTNVKVKTAEYLKSCVAVADCPPPRFTEFAVIGRSNVGKSSLINMITGRKELALVSKQPGKTKCINHFLINGSWYLVDLPGYGFAKVGLQGRQQFDAFTREYFKTRPNLAMVFMLVDASIPPQKIDLEYANWLTDNEVPFTLVFTKADKRRKGVPTSARDSHVTAFKRALLRDLAFLPPSILTSSAKGLGRGEMLNFIAGLRIAFEKSGRLAAIRQGMC